ncbi:unnamed protein product, partial [Prorocentrum cordatum]
DKRNGFFGETDEYNDDRRQEEERCEIADIVDQLVNLADEEDEALIGDADEHGDPEDGVYAELKQMGRNYKEARDLIRKLRLARDYYLALAKDCPERGKARGKVTPNDTMWFALLELGELVLLLDDVPGIWAILDCGATRSLIGVSMAEYLTYDMEENFGLEFEGDHSETVELSIVDYEMPLLIGMDLLGPDRTSALIDCGKGYLMMPKMSPHPFECQKMPSGHLAINVATPKWWETVFWSIPNASYIGTTLALEDKTLGK